MKFYMKTALVSAFVSASIAIILLFLMGNGSEGQPSHLDSIYAQARAVGTLRAAYVVGAPLFTIDPNSKAKAGIFYDVVTRATGKLGLKVNWNEEIGYGEMVQRLDARRYDIVGSGVWINADRGKQADFTVPIYYDAVFAYVRHDDGRFDTDLSILNSPRFTISVMDGELSTSIAESDFPEARTLALPQNADFTQLILNVTTGKADITFLSAAAAHSYQIVHPNQIRAVGPIVRIFGNAIMIPPGQYELRQALNYALTDMVNTGEIESILRKYEQSYGSFIRPALPYQVPVVSK